MTSLQDVAFAASVKETGMGETQPCVDPECDGTMETEQDGDHQYMECGTCGYSSTYTKVPTSVLTEDADGNCSIGVPADLRRQASQGMTNAMAQQAKDEGKVDLGLTIGKRPGV